MPSPTQDFGLLLLKYFGAGLGPAVICFAWLAVRTSSKTAQPTDLCVLKRQRWWRAAKGATVICGGIALFATAMGFDKLAEDLWRPDTQRRVDRNVENLKVELYNLEQRYCNSPEIGKCQPVKKLLADLNSIEVGNPGLKDIAPTTDLLFGLEKSKQVQARFASIQNDFGVLQTKPAFSGESKLQFALWSALMVGLALAISLGESIFQVRIDGIKIANEEKKLKNAKDDRIDFSILSSCSAK